MAKERAPACLIGRLSSAILMASRVFISFRSADAPEMGCRLCDSLVHSFHYECLLMNEERSSVSGYPAEREDSIAACDAFIAMIGPGWLMRYDERGRPGLFHRDDYVRKDIAAALERDVPILAVLVEDTAMPPASRLPADLLLLAYQSAAVLRLRSFDQDVAKIVAELCRLAPPH